MFGKSININRMPQRIKKEKCVVKIKRKADGTVEKSTSGCSREELKALGVINEDGA